MKNVRRGFAALLVLAMLLPSILVPGLAAGKFQDIPEDSWYSEAVEYVTERGYMAGVSEESFAPNMPVTRAMFVAILAKVAKADLDDTVSAFSDVPAGKWYTGAVAWAAEKGIVTGISATEFGPDRKITRQDMCVIMTRFAEVMEYELPQDTAKSFTDARGIAKYAKDAVAACTSAGLIAGYSDGSFRPKGTATRAQIAVIIMRLDQILQGQNVDPVPMPAQSFDGAAGEGMNVSVNAPEGALPENTNMTVSRVTDEAALAAIKAKTGTEIYAAADITFTKDGAELEPEKAVEVQIALDGLESIKNPTVVHVKDDGSVEYVAAEVISATRGTQKALRFYAKSFSVYAVIDDPSGNNAFTVTVNFYVRKNQASGPDGSDSNWELINKQIIRSNQIDAAKDNDDILIFDPGVPELKSTQAFEGWAGTKNFTDNDDKLSVADMNAKIKADYKDGTLREAVERSFYAEVYDVVYITYHDQKGTVLETQFEHVDSTRKITKQFIKAYSPFKDDQAFFGWIPAAGIKTDENGKLLLGDYPEYTDNAASLYYKLYDANNAAATTYEITYQANANNLDVYPYLAKGYWLIYDTNIDGNNTANGFTDATSATYTGPKLYRAGENTVAPTQPTRTGYTFGGWYTDPSMRTQFTFGSPLTETTTIYAKWTPNTDTPYTVIIWTQKASDAYNAADADKEYDFYKAITTRTGKTGTTANFTSDDSDLGGTASKELGYYFTYNAANSDTSGVMIRGDGTTVVNVRYDRRVLTFNFYQGSVSSSNFITSRSGLYEAELNNWPDLPSSSYNVWKYTDPNDSGTYYFSADLAPDHYISWVANNATWNLYSGSTSKYTYSAPVYFWQEQLDGTYAKYQESTVTANTTYTSSYNYETQLYDGYEYFGFTGVGYNYYNNSMSNSYYKTWTPVRGEFKEFTYWDVTTSANIYYTRNKWKLEFFSNGETAAAADLYAASNVQDISNVYFDKPLSGYEPTKIPSNGPDGCFFEGWYKDPGCTEKFDWTENMPNNNVAVYAKWTPTRYRAILDFTGGDPNVHPADIHFPGNQATAFRLDYLEQIQSSSIQACSRDGYVLLGWYYYDKNGNVHEYDFSMGANDEMADMTYGTQGADETDEAYAARMNGDTRAGSDPFNPANPTYNDTWDTDWETHDYSSEYSAAGYASADKMREARGKYRVVRGKITIYAKWRVDPEAVADAKVVYHGDHDETDTGYFETDGQPHIWIDPKSYGDMSQAYAQAASVPETEGEQFLYWEVLRPVKDENGEYVKDANGEIVFEPTGEKAYPGQTFEVNLDDAVKTRTYIGGVDPNHEHELEHVEASDPTCTVAGNLEHWRCTICGKCFSDAAGETEVTQASVTVAALGHDVEGVAWSYAGTGHWQVCKREGCGAHVNGAAHTMVEDMSQHVDPSIGSTGFTHEECSVCGYEKDTVLPALTGYTVTYHVPTGLTAPAAQTEVAGTEITLPTMGNSGDYTFLGWVTAEIPTATDTQPTILTGAYTVSANADLYAVYSYTEGSGASGEYELVTSAPADWTGNYVITYLNTTSMYVMKGVTPSSNGADIESSDNASSYSAAGVSLSGTTLSNVSNNYVFTLAKHGSYYSIQNVATGTYLGMDSGCGEVRGYTTYTSGDCDWTPGPLANATSALNSYNNTADGSYPYLSYSTNSNNLFFWAGSSSGTATTSIYWWKETTTTTTYYTTVFDTTPGGTDYTVSFSVPEGVTAIADMTVNSATGATLPTAGAPEGYTFLGWVTDTVDNVAAEPANILTGTYRPTANITLKALYSYTGTIPGGYKLSTEAPTSGENVILAVESNGTYYALPNITSSSSSVTPTTLTIVNGVTNTSDVVWTATTVGTALRLTHAADTSKYLKINSGALNFATATGTDYNGDLTFTAVGDGTYNVSNGASTVRAIGWNGTQFTSVLSTASNIANICIFKYQEGTTGGTVYTTEIPTGSAATFTVTYMANGSQMDQVSVVEGESINLPTTATAVTDWTFIGWVEEATTANAEPTYLAKGASVTPTGDKTYYALYSKTEGGSGTEWVAVTSASDVVAGEYVITWNNTYYLPSETTATQNPAVGTGITVSDGKLTNTVTSNMQWTFVEDTDHSCYTIQHTGSSSTYYLTAKNDSKGIQVQTSNPGYSGSYSYYNGWTAIDNATYGLLLRSSDGGTRNLAVYDSATWRYYAAGSSYSGTLRLYKQTTSGGTTTWTTTPGSGSNAVNEPMSGLAETRGEPEPAPEEILADHPDVFRTGDTTAATAAGLQNVGPVVPVTADGDVWTATDTITSGEQYLIGYHYRKDTDSDGTYDIDKVYLLMSYNPAASAYYTSSSISGYTATKVCYAIPAVLDANGNVIGVDTTNFSGATLNHVKWTFNQQTSGKYNIQSVYNTSYYLRVAEDSTDTDLQVYPATSSTYYTNYWVWEDNTLSHYYSSSYLRKYISVLTSSSTNEVTCFDVDSDTDYAKTLTLYKLADETYTLTIHYQYENGTTASADHVETDLANGYAYSVVSPSIDGYSCGTPIVSGTIQGANAEITVVYSEIVVSDEEWEPTTEIKPGEDYLIAYVINGTPYLLVNYNVSATNHYYYSYTGTSTSYTMGYLAPAVVDSETGYVIGVSGAANNLNYCKWLFETAQGGTITSSYEEGRKLYWNNSGVYPNTTGDSWVWTVTDAANNLGTMHNVYTNSSNETTTVYFWTRSSTGGEYSSGTPYAGVYSSGTPATIRLYKRHVDEDTTWTVKFVNYNYTSLAGAGYPDQIITNGEKVTEPTTDPTRNEDYEFAGWYIIGQDEPYDFSTPVTRNLTLQARYTMVYTYTYNLHLRAVYGMRNTTGKTHIYWYANDGTDAGHGVGAGDRFEQNEIDMNMAYSIPFPTVNETPAGKLTWTGGTWQPDQTQSNPTGLNYENRVFLGWARVNTTGAGVTGTAHPELVDEDDLYLKWNSEEGCFEYKESNRDGTESWTPLASGQVYADESQPYHDMYAVWGYRPFFVFHSATGKLEAINITTNKIYDDETGKLTKFEEVPYDLTALVPDGYLYGGYYTSYGGVNTTAVQTAANNYLSAASPWTAATTHTSQVAEINASSITGANFVAYDGSAVKNGSTRFWTKTQAYGVGDQAEAKPGNEMTPVAGKVYYLKEVPETYLTTKYLYTYETMEGENEGVIQNFFMLTVMDDAFYKEIGFRTVEGAEDVREATNADITPRTAIAGKFEVIQRGNGISTSPRCNDTVVTVDPSSFGLTRGYIAVTQADALITEEAGKSFTVMPAWETLDGVEVNSHGTLKLDVSSDKKTIDYELLGSVATPTTLFIDTDPSHLVLNQDDGTVWETADALTRVYIFNGSKDMWLDATKVRDNYYSVSIPAGDWTLIVVRCNPDPNKTGWDAKWTQTVNIPLDRSKDLLILNSGFNDGKLNSYTYTVVNNN